MARRTAPHISFRGFIVLADIIFALAVGFMLLHPLKPPQEHRAPPAPQPAAEPLQGALDALLVKLREGRDDLKDLQSRLEDAVASGRNPEGSVQ